MARMQRVLITAGASGIGREIARAFSAAGAKVAVVDIDATALTTLQTELPAVIAEGCDLGELAQIEVVVPRAIEALGGLDVLVNNAGIAGPTSPIETMQLDDWRRCIAVNLDSIFHCTRRAVPLLKQAGGGSVILMSSVAGRLGYPLRSPYTASKFAIVGLAETLAMELGPDRIRVNCIQPGFVDGERIDRVIAAKAAARGITIEQQTQEFLSRVSLRTMVTMQDIANMALFLASAAGQHISGQALSVCGNIEVLG